MIKSDYSNDELVELTNAIMQGYGATAIEETISYNADNIDNKDTTIFAQLEDDNSIVLIYDENGVDKQVENSIFYIKNRIEDDDFVLGENMDLGSIVIQSILSALNVLFKDDALKVSEVISLCTKSRLSRVMIPNGKYKGNYFVYNYKL